MKKWEHYKKNGRIFFLYVKNRRILLLMEWRVGEVSFLLRYPPSPPKADSEDDGLGGRDAGMFLEDYALVFVRSY